MQILFVISASLWAWLVGRTIAFGPNIKTICWHPNMHADTWYRLTPNPYNIPHTYFPIISYIFAGLAIPSLFVYSNIIHTTTVLRLVSEHAYIPIFVAHIHSEKILTLWPLLNAGTAIGTVLLLSTHNTTWAIIAIIPTFITIILHLWFVCIQLHLLCKQTVIHQEEAYQERQPRIV